MTHIEKRKELETILRNRLANERGFITIRKILLYFDSYDFSQHETFTNLYLFKGVCVSCLIDLDDLTDEEINEIRGNTL